MPNDLPDWQRLVAAPLKVGSVSAAPGATASADIAAPFGHLAIGFMVDFSGGNGNPTNVQILGNQTLTTYLNVANPTGGGPHVAMSAGTDTTYHLSVTAPIAATAKAFLVAWFSQPVVALNPNVEAPVPVTFFSASNALLVAQPAPWQAPKNRIVFSASVASGATATVLAAQGGVTFYLHTFSVMTDGSNAAGQVTLQDTAAGNLLVTYTNATRQVMNRGSFFGLPLTQGTGVQVVNGGAAAEFFGVNLAYNQV